MKSYFARLRGERRDWKQKLVDLKGGKCVDCGYAAHLAALEFDHLDPAEKKNTISALLNWCAPWARVVEEAMKCDLVCSNCHAIRTYVRSHL
jgi:hypothetical protein